MEKQFDRKSMRRRIRYRVRGKLRGSAAQPRLAVYRSLKNIYVQAVDDDRGVTIVSAGTLEKSVQDRVKSGGNIAAATEVGKLIAERLKDKGIDSAVFDRGGFRYHGRVKALADAAREGGIKM